jgi:hypothetical protein
MFALMDAKKESERIIKVVSEILIEEKRKHESKFKNIDDKTFRPVVSIVSDNVY